MTDYCKTCFHVKDAHFDTTQYVCSVPDCKCQGYIHGETRVTSDTGAQKGTKEERFDLIPVPALTYLARLYGKGALKYSDHNWRLGYDWSKSYSAAQRHMNSFWSGEDIDPETQVPHVINAAFHMFALATYLTEHPELDDRFETRESRSDAEEEEEETRGLITVDGELRTQFFTVRGRRRHDGVWVHEGFYFSKDKARERINDLVASEITAMTYTDLDIFEGVFQDG